MKKIITVTERVDLVELFVLKSNNLSDAIEHLRSLAATYGSSARFSIESIGYDGAYEWEVVHERLENDEEYASRVQEEAKLEAAKLTAIAKKEEAERKELARLQKKYGK